MLERFQSIKNSDDTDIRSRFVLVWKREIEAERN